MANIYPSLSNAEYIAIDTETYDPNLDSFGSGSIRKDGYLVGVSISTGAFTQYYPIAHQGGGNLPRDVVIRYLKRELSNSIPKIGANIQYDLGWLHSEGIIVNGRKYDIQIIEALIDENQNTYTLESLCQKYLGKGKDESKLILSALALGIPEKKIKENLWRLNAAAVKEYAEFDALGTLQVFLAQHESIKEQELDVVHDLESRLIPALFDIRQEGIPVSHTKAEQAIITCQKVFNDRKDMLNRTCGFDVDVWSGKSLASAYDSQGLSYPLTEKGNPSFTGDWLDAQNTEFSSAVRTVRKLDRAANVFIQNKIINASVNGRIHPNFRQTRVDEGGTRSGRFSSANPNMQQVPARDPILAPLIRGIFVPDKGYAYGVFDYSQQEPRVTLHYAHILDLPGAKEALAKYLENPKVDYHQLVADMCLVVSGVDIGRKAAKTLNLGLAYGMGIYKLAASLGLSVEDAKPVMSAYHKAIGYVRALGDFAARKAKEKGFVKTLLGRRRHFPGGEGTHKALNAVVQGSSADMMKQSMVNLYEAGFRIYNTVHDEINLPIPIINGKIDLDFARNVRDIMCESLKLRVPLVVDFECGPSWGEAEVCHLD